MQVTEGGVDGHRGYLSPSHLYTSFFDNRLCTSLRYTNIQTGYYGIRLDAALLAVSSARTTLLPSVLVAS